MNRLLLISAFLLSGILSLAQPVSITTLNTAYTQDFNTLAVSGTSSTLPVGWLLAEAGTNANNTYAADNGNVISGNSYSYGTGTATDRAFGGLQSGSLVPTLGVAFTNNTGSNITSLAISYTGEMWRAGVLNRGAADRLDFQYSVDATSLTDGSWTDVNNLDFNSPVISTAVGPLDGNLSANRTAVSFTITGLNIPNGSTFYLRWVDFNIASSDDGLAIDDFSLSANGNAAPACVAPTAAPTALALTPSSSSVLGSFTAASDANGYLVAYSTNSSLGFTPVNGTSYSVGQTVGNGTVAAFGSGTSFALAGLTPSTTYYFFVFGFNSFGCTGGPLYFGTALTGNTATTAAGSGNGIPDGYYNAANGKTCADLKTALKVRTGTDVNGQPVSPKTYTELWSQYQVSDVKPREVGTGSADVIWDVYSDNPNGPDPYNFTPGSIANGGQQDDGTNVNAEGVLYNREHSVPTSWFNGDTQIPGAATDYHHIFPTDKWVNSLRSNFIYGEVASPATTTQNGGKLGPVATAGLTGTAFEPIDAYKGDLARAFLYFVTRYEDNMPAWNGGTAGAQAFDPSLFPSVDVPYLQLMIKWHKQDPVSAKEIARNNAAFAYQGNRNPFVDHPEYVELVWNSSCSGLSALPVHLLDFRGVLKGSDVELQWLTENETAFDRFEVQRSRNGRDYSTIGTVKAGGLRQYRFTDKAEGFSGRVYYRLKMIDQDGSSRLSQVFSVHLKPQVRFQVYPNPASSRVTLELGSAAFTGTIAVTDMTGRVLLSRQVTGVQGPFVLPVQGLATGRYVVQLKDAAGQVSAQPLNIVR
ncbi:MAG: endonuclease [Chitinophagaceae bacterium]|nr:endonuclease [Chitinophagaceae bacterium]